MGIFREMTPERMKKIQERERREAEERMERRIAERWVESERRIMEDEYCMRWAEEEEDEELAETQQELAQAQRELAKAIREQTRALEKDRLDRLKAEADMLHERLLKKYKKEEEEYNKKCEIYKDIIIETQKLDEEKSKQKYGRDMEGWKNEKERAREEHEHKKKKIELENTELVEKYREELAEYQKLPIIARLFSKKPEHPELLKIPSEPMIPSPQKVRIRTEEEILEHLFGIIRPKKPV